MKPGIPSSSSSSPDASSLDDSASDSSRPNSPLSALEPNSEGFNLSQINTVLILTKDLLDSESIAACPQTDQKLDTDKDATQDLYDILTLLLTQKEMEYKTIKDTLIDSLNTLQEQKQYSARDIAIAWRNILIIEVGNCKFYKKTDHAFKDYHQDVKKLYKKSTLSMVDVTYYDLEGAPFKKKETVFNIEKEEAQRIILNLLMQLSHANGIETARAIHNLLVVARHMAFAEEVKYQGREKGHGYRLVAAWCSPLLFHALSHLSKIDKHDSKLESVFFSNLCTALLQLPRFDSLYVESYGLVQMNNILLLINEFMAPNCKADIIRLDDTKGVLTRLKAKLNPHLTMQLSFYEGLKGIARDLIAQIQQDPKITDDDISLALGHFLRVSFGNSHLFENDHPILSKFHKNLHEVYQKATISTVFDEEVGKDIVQIKFNMKDPLKYFKAMMKSLVNSDNNVEIARAVHNFLVIGKKCASSKGDKYITEAGLVPALTRALKVEGKLDFEDRTNEQRFLSIVLVELLKSDNFDRIFNPEIYYEDKKSIVKQLKRLSLSGTTHPPKRSPERSPEPPTQEPEQKSPRVDTQMNDKIPLKQLSLEAIEEYRKNQEKRKKTSCPDSDAPPLISREPREPREPGIQIPKPLITRTRTGSGHREIKVFPTTADDILYFSEVETTRRPPRTYLPSASSREKRKSSRREPVILTVAFSDEERKTPKQRTDSK